MYSYSEGNFDIYTQDHKKTAIETELIGVNKNCESQVKNNLMTIFTSLNNSFNSKTINKGTEPEKTEIEFMSSNVSRNSADDLYNNYDKNVMQNDTVGENSSHIFSTNEENFQLQQSDTDIGTQNIFVTDNLKMNETSLENNEASAGNSCLSIFKRKHNRGKTYKCDICGVEYIHSGNYYKHKKAHTGVKPYKCGICDASFSGSSDLSRHIRIHTGEKPYKCDICDTAFTYNSTLAKHKRIHTGEKPFKCDVCGAGFTSSSGLTRHRKIHTGERPYKCDICEAAFADSTCLMNHIRIHTGEKPFTCDFCGTDFANRSNLSRHKKIHKGDGHTRGRL